MKRPKASIPTRPIMVEPIRSVLITGASRGIGAAIAAEYRRHGWNVVAPSRAECDLRSPRAVMAWIKGSKVKCDALVNNAGENNICLVEDMKLESWDGTFAINLTTPMLLSQAVARHMRAQGWGRVVNVSSIFGHVSRGGRASYASSKTALIGFTRTAAIEWGPENVLVNAICPGYIETDLTRANNSPAQLAGLAEGLPLRRLGQPEEVAKAVFFLGSDQNTFITGQSILIDGGFTAQ
jgi:3-oxoacyl-[acyl-carrier protein] reductase